MKTWEMIKELTLNPKKAFKRDYDGLIVKVDEVDETLRWKSGYDYLCIDDQWEEVKEPVTWQEAFQAGLEGKKIKVDGQGFTYQNFENLHFALFYLSERPKYFEKLMNSNWYIE